MPFSFLTDEQLQTCHHQHLQHVRDTRRVESLRVSLVGSHPVIPPLSNNQCWNFAQEVCAWGGKTGPRILGRIRTTPSANAILASALQNAINALQTGGQFAGLVPTGHSSLLHAKNALSPVKGLGGYSYSTKFIRMLCPENSGVMDSLIAAYLCKSSPRWARTPPPDRYLGYCELCQSTASRLRAFGILLGDHVNQSLFGSGVQTSSNSSMCLWNAADVDMAFFAWLQGWCTGCAHPAPESEWKNNEKKRKSNQLSQSCPTKTQGVTSGKTITLYLGNTKTYHPLKLARNGPNVGYIVKSNGMLCVYKELASIFAGKKISLPQGGRMPCGGSPNQHAGNLAISGNSVASSRTWLTGHGFQLV